MTITLNERSTSSFILLQLDKPFFSHMQQLVTHLREAASPKGKSGLFGAFLRTFKKNFFFRKDTVTSFLAALWFHPPTARHDARSTPVELSCSDSSSRFHLVLLTIGARDLLGRGGSRSAHWDGGIKLPLSHGSSGAKETGRLWIIA